MRLATVAMAAALLFAAALFGSPASAQTASPQSWPQRPVKFILPLGPGSGADIGARLIAEKLTAKWGQPVVVENRPGGDGFVAINAFTRRPRRSHRCSTVPRPRSPRTLICTRSCPTIRATSRRSRAFPRR